MSKFDLSDLSILGNAAYFLRVFWPSGQNDPTCLSSEDLESFGTSCWVTEKNKTVADTC